MESEIYMDVNLTRYPLRDYKSMWSEMNNVVKDYSKIGKRNQHAIEHNKLGKHMMHLIRLYMMCLDILENKDIVTFRSKEHNLLMSIRNGEYLDENRQPIPEFFEMVDEYEKKMKYAKENTDLPEKPDYKRIQEFVMSVNERIDTDICVVANALIIKTLRPDIEITVDAGCCAGSTPEKHRAALEVMKSCQIDVIGE